MRDRGEPDFQEHLRDAFVSLFSLYPEVAYFDLTTTANVVLQSHVNQRYSVFYGQDFADNDFTFGAPETIRNLGDVANINTNFDVSDFETVFFGNFENTEVSVHSIISIVFIITRYMDNFEQDKTVGQQLIKLY